MDAGSDPEPEARDGRIHERGARPAQGNVPGRARRAREEVRHVWLVEPTDRTLEAFELREGEWVLIAAAKDDDPISIRPFDAITFSLGDLWP